jgi:hypothetical protein
MIRMANRHDVVEGEEEGERGQRRKRKSFARSVVVCEVVSATVAGGPLPSARWLPQINLNQLIQSRLILYYIIFYFVVTLIL